MAKKNGQVPEGTFEMFDVQEISGRKPSPEAVIEGNLWTYQKAQLISRYLYSFLSVTKNGIYIDAFAGPQEIEHRDDSWAALHLLQKGSHFLKRACLFEQDPEKIPFLEGLRRQYCQGWTRLWRRQVVVTEGDCNVKIPEYLRLNPIKTNRATFALLDQRTHECSWNLVKTLAAHKQKQGGNKVELFYFLAQGWMNRSIKSSTQASKLKEIEDWWGNSDWRSFLDLSSYERARAMEARFKEELGYKFARAFPMKDKNEEGRILFWLIHASDHPRANPLMISAYRSIGLKWSDEEWEQMKMDDVIKRLDDKNFGSEFGSLDEPPTLDLDSSDGQSK